MVGTPYTTVDGETEAGAVYVFDRNVQTFIKNDDSSNAYTVLGTVTGPVSVIVNNQFLINQTDSTIGAANSFTVSGNTININADLIIGDTIQIETNQFSLIQQVDQNTAAEFCNFGQAVDICTNNCSLYVGEPQSSQQIFKGGVVERFVNQSRIYGTITATLANPVLTAGNTIRINNIDVEVPASDPTVQGLADQINGVPVGSQTGVQNVLATVSATGYLTISVKNPDAASPFNKVQVAPGSVGTAFADLGFETFAWTQTIESPYPIEYAGFGSSLSIDDSAVNLVVGCPKGSLYLITVFDDGTTFFDAGTTIFFSIFVQSGAIYTYDYLPSSTLTVTNPGKFVFGQQVNNNQVGPYDAFGTSVNYTSGVLMAGAPKNDAGDSSADFGAMFVFENTTQSPAWSIINIQQPTVDIRLLNSVFLYDRITSAKTEFLDFINPLQGKILGAAQQNIDYDTDGFGQGLIARQLRRGKGIVNWNKQARAIKWYLYPELLNQIHVATKDYTTLAEKQLWVLNNESTRVATGSGLLAPGAFLDLADESGLIAPIGDWVLNESARTVAEWISTGLVDRGMAIHVNASRRQLSDITFVDRALTILRDNNLEGSQLVFETSEATLVDNNPSVLRTVTALKRQGVRIAVDDFGAGYSSLASLRTFPADLLKLDGTLVRDVGRTDGGDDPMVRSLIQLAHSLNLIVCAEWVTTEDHVQRLKVLGCDLLQGNRIGEPISAEAFATKLRRTTAQPVQATD
jgi:EAL domain-containing protein (putative c-di-GMP-specific phosphodiesterase class I)